MIFGGAIALLAAGGAAVATQMAGVGHTTLDKPAIEQIVKDYILEHPDIIPQAMERLRDQRVKAVIDKNRPALEKPYAGAWEGAADGDVIVVEFFDYACGYCRASLPDLARLVEADSRVKIVYRELPILSDDSALAARVSLLAAEQGKYMPYHRALYAAGEVNRTTILAAAATAGLDRKQAEAAIVDHRYDAEVQNNIRMAQELQASGTPTFVVGGKVLGGAVGFEALKDAVAAVRDAK